MKIHLTGIGGVGMAGLAFLLKRRGHEVDGCDLKATPRTQWLERVGVPVAIGHDAAHVEGKDLVIVTPAVAKDNPEYVAALASRSGYNGVGESSLYGERPASLLKTRGEVLARIVSEASDSIAVCGSHGKTTTATFIAKLLIALGEKVEWAIGGETGDFPVAGGDGGVLVVEADESDGTLALYHAKTLVVTNCEYDHPDHFKTKEEYFACYEAAKRNADKVILGIGEMGTSDPNARLAARVALARGHSPERIAAALPGVTAALPDRRFQQLNLPLSHFNSNFHSHSHFNSNSHSHSHSNSHSHSPLPLVFADYGHHPTEIRYAIARARSLLLPSSPSHPLTSSPSHHKLRVLFQPHRYSRTAAFKKEFAEALVLADEVVICPIYAAFEKPVEGGDSCDLYATLREVERRGGGGQRSFKVYLAKSCGEAWEHACNSMKDGDVTLIQGAGVILEKVKRKSEKGKSEGEKGKSEGEKVKRKSEKGKSEGEKGRSAEVRRVWVGAETNLVRSDLNLNVEYVKTTHPAGAPGSSLITHHSSLLPFMAGIPGTIGGWVKMNAGAHGHSISEVLARVKIDGEWVPASSCGFGYRTSNITGEIQDVRFAESKEEKGKVKKCGEETHDAAYYLAKRKKFPPHTKGSVFKNPEGDFAGRLLEECGVKGLRVGGAYVWEEHANVIVAPPGSATASDFLALMQIMRNRVFLRKGILLDLEVRFGDF